MLKVDLSGAKMFFDPAGPDYAAAAEAHRSLFGQSAKGSESLAWLDLPQHVMENQLKAILAAADKIKRQSDLLLVVGVGGCYLGAKAAIEMLQTPSHNRISGETEVHFIGPSLSPDALNELIVLMGDRDFSVNVISKSGTTAETMLAFRMAKSLLERKYGRAGAKRRIIATTALDDNPLLRMAEKEGYELLSLPSHIPGRFAVLTAACLLPMAVAGIDIKTVLISAAEAMRQLAVGSPENPAWQYAAARQQLYRRGKSIEILAYYEPAMHSFAEWWKQLFAESEGKNSIGIFPASARYSADLYSTGQYIHDGPRCIMESVLSFDNPRTALKLPFEMGDGDGYNFLAGHQLSEIMNATAAAVKAAHISVGVPNIGISLPCRDEAGFASLVCFFQVSCAISACMMGVDPFNQPGVDEYKKKLYSFLKGEN